MSVLAGSAVIVRQVALSEEEGRASERLAAQLRPQLTDLAEAAARLGRGAA